jgi:methylated-DNA-[protein]-cysteine S-methyltransferase
MPSDPTSLLLHHSPIGPLTLHAGDTGVQHLYFPGRGPISTGLAQGGDALTRAGEQLSQYFSGAREQFELSLAPAGTAFQRRVWELLQEIPYGERTTYGALARRLTGERGGKWVEPQAVAGAVARTPIPIIIPCHRVIGADGSLRGYVGGLGRKQKLLDFEASQGNPEALGDTWRDRQLALL